MTITAIDFLAQLEASGVSATVGAPESPVTETCQMMGSESVINEETFDMAQTEPEPAQEPDVSVTMGPDLS